MPEPYVVDPPGKPFAERSRIRTLGYPGLEKKGPAYCAGDDYSLAFVPKTGVRVLYGWVHIIVPLHMISSAIQVARLDTPGAYSGSERRVGGLHCD